MDWAGLYPGVQQIYQDGNELYFFCLYFSLVVGISRCLSTSYRKHSGLFWLRSEALMWYTALVGTLKKGTLDWWWGVLVLRLKTMKGGQRNKRQERKTQQRKKKANDKDVESAGWKGMMEEIRDVGPWAWVRERICDRDSGQKCATLEMGESQCDLPWDYSFGAWHMTHMCTHRLT